MDILLTFTGNHDPYAFGVLEGDELPGPVLTVLGHRAFDRVVLFGTPGMRESAEHTCEALETRFPHIAVDLRDVPLADPTDYRAILAVMRLELDKLRRAFPKASFFVSVASGTPQIHACWLVLLNETPFPVRLLQARPPRFVTDDVPPVMELDPESLFQMGKGVPPRAESVARRERPPARSRRQGGAEDVSRPSDSALHTARAKLGIVGDHPQMIEVLERTRIAAASTLTVLISGETGTGKELLARLIHMLSDRVTAPFVPLNCGAIPKDLAESTLFGHIKGAFTGAVRDQEGRFATADNGTLFLDEVGELPLDVQVKLLRVLEDGLVQPIGARKAKKVNVRIVAASNRDLRERAAKREFREDLYYRLASVELRIPALRERPSDIPRIALHLLDGINQQLRTPKQLSRGALRKLQQHSWPGNVRDLHNVLSQSCLFSKGDVIDAGDVVFSRDPSLKTTLQTFPLPHEGFCVKSFLEEARKRFFVQALEFTGGNKSKAARLLGISPQAVQKFLERQEAQKA